MKINFVNNDNSNLGAYRIYIKNLCKWCLPFVDNAQISELPKSGFDVYLFSKYTSPEQVIAARREFGDKTIGIVHPSDHNRAARKKIGAADFLVVGSIEERDYYLSYHQNVFRFPQLEDIETRLKRHENSGTIKIGYHGNLEHLEEMDRAAKPAIEEIAKTIPLELIVVTDQRGQQWVKGRPDVPTKMIEWTFDRMVSEMSEVDIGIVPCIAGGFLDRPVRDCNPLTKLIKKRLGRINDYRLSFKNTSNAGRAFVFHQLGIPVVADFWPSHFELLGNRNYGELVHSAQGWINALTRLAGDSSLRSRIAEAAQREFVSRYDPADWASDLIKNMAKASSKLHISEH